MTSRQKDSPRTQEVLPVENNPMIRTRLRTLMELAITIGRREGLLGDIGDSNVEGGQDVGDKGNIRGCKSLPSGKN